MINDDLINTLKSNFSGSSDYLSGVNGGLYTMLNTIQEHKPSEEKKTIISEVLDLWHTLDEDEKALALTKFKTIMKDLK